MLRPHAPATLRASSELLVHGGCGRELPPGVSISAIAEVGSLVGDPARTNMLVALLAGRALSARELADRAGVTPQTASGHLAKLLSAGMISMERCGRQHLHRIASAGAVRLIEALHIAGAELSPKGSRAIPSGVEARMARTCHDHLAGSLGVEMACALTDGAALDRLSSEGRARLVRWGVDVEPLNGPRRELCAPCLDWSEHRPHLAGAIGASVLQRALGVGWLRSRDRGPVLKVTTAGRRGFHERFGIIIDS